MIKRDETTELPISIGPKETVYEDINQQIYKIVAQFKNFKKEYFVSNYGNRAASLVINNNKVLFCRQYRFLINNISYEIPGGKVDLGESFEQAAKRECYEETGVKISKTIPLINFQAGLDTNESYTKVYYSNTIDEERNHKSKNKKWISLKNCIRMIYKEEINDQLSIIAILAYVTKNFIKD